MKRLALLLLMSVPLPACVESAPPGPAAAREVAVRALRWTGIAEVYPPGRTLKLGVETAVTPFVRARSDTWILEQGRSSMRSLIIEPSGGTILRGGRSEAMPALMLRHERQQYAIYGQMQRAMTLARHSLPPNRRLVIAGDGENSVDTEFVFDAHGRLTGATNTVVDPAEPGVTIPQEFTFSGEVRSNGLRWPQRIAIRQKGVPYFVLEIERFEALDPSVDR